ncbi:hypothetical protein EDC04DRAFT_3092376 [Pisolithus marmoratus]|nr:hypothetical protein EDC04DRAFT_3092376 [Pisolithus marmoratus]
MARVIGRRNNNVVAGGGEIGANDRIIGIGRAANATMIGSGRSLAGLGKWETQGEGVAAPSEPWATPKPSERSTGDLMVSRRISGRYHASSPYAIQNMYVRAWQRSAGRQQHEWRAICRRRTSTVDADLAVCFRFLLSATSAARQLLNEPTNQAVSDNSRRGLERTIAKRGKWLKFRCGHTPLRPAGIRSSLCNWQPEKGKVISQ